MPTIIHFEIPADDVERAKKFYSDLFGWKMEKWSGEEGNHYNSSNSNNNSPSSSSSNMDFW